MCQYLVIPGLTYLATSAAGTDMMSAAMKRIMEGLRPTIADNSSTTASISLYANTCVQGAQSEVKSLCVCQKNGDETSFWANNVIHLF